MATQVGPPRISRRIHQRIPGLRTPGNRGGEDTGESPKSRLTTLVVGTVVTALGTVGTAFGVALANDTDKNHTEGSSPKSPPIIVTQPSDRGSVDEVRFDSANTTVTLSGRANRDVEAVGVVMTAANDRGLSYIGETSVSDGNWTLEMPTASETSAPFTVRASYRVRAGMVPAVRPASYTFKLDTPTPNPSPPSPAPCTPKTPDSCFTGPGWGSPSIYQSQQ